jgi:hypothetical protein
MFHFIAAIDGFHVPISVILIKYQTADNTASNSNSHQSKRRPELKPVIKRNLRTSNTTIQLIYLEREKRTLPSRNCRSITDLGLYSRFLPADRKLYIYLLLTRSDTFTEYFHTKHRNVRSRYTMAQLVGALCYKPEGRGFDSRWCHWNFSLT